MKILEEELESKKETQKIILERDQVCTVGVSPNVKITVACLDSVKRCLSGETWARQAK